ncbi:ankyrin repeat-containing domain protein [Tuber indicum]|nr:ankyrin repeat-containing domain protein [Tuber indicum]
MRFLDLPNEVILLIARQQRPSDLNALLRTNQHLASILKIALIDRVCELRDEQMAKRAIYLAANREDRAGLRFFIDRGLHQLVAGGAVLNDAVMTTDVNVLCVLLECGISPETRDQNQQTALSIACQHNRLNALRMLLDDPRVDLNSQDITGRTPLSYAAGGGHVGVVRVLLADTRVDTNLGCKNPSSNSSSPLLVTHQ